MSQDEKRPNHKNRESSSRVEEFLDAVGRKTNDKVHQRILHACRLGDPATCVEEELRKVIEEILYET